MDNPPLVMYFSGESSTKIDNFEITDLHMYYIHASLPTQERHFGSKSCSFGVRMFGNRKITLSRCSWAVSSFDHICMSNPRKNIPMFV